MPPDHLHVAPLAHYHFARAPVGPNGPTLLRERRAALAKVEPPRVPARSSVGWSTQPPSRAFVVGSVASGACQRDQLARPAPSVTTHADRQSGSSHATTRAAAAIVVHRATSTRCGESRTPPSVVASD